MIWEQRWHPLRREWVIVSSHRGERPWQGERVGGAPRALPPYVQDCYLCPGNVRSSGERNDRYTGVFVFDNDHPCVGPAAPTELAPPPGIYRNAPAVGCARVVCFTPRHDQALSFIPYFARYPYETFVAPRATHPSLAHLSAAELSDFAAVLRETLIRLDNLWRLSFPYVMVLHQAPTDGSPHAGFHFHIQIHAPLRKPGLLKYLAGPEIGGGNFLNDAAPEDTAAELQAVAGVHYTQGG